MLPQAALLLQAFARCATASRRDVLQMYFLLFMQAARAAYIKLCVAGNGGLLQRRLPPAVSSEHTSPFPNVAVFAAFPLPTLLNNTGVTEPPFP